MTPQISVLEDKSYFSISKNVLKQAILVRYEKHYKIWNQ